MPPVLPERAPRGEVIERDDKLAGAIQHKIIFTDITNHKINKNITHHNKVRAVSV